MFISLLNEAISKLSRNAQCGHIEAHFDESFEIRSNYIFGLKTSKYNTVFAIYITLLRCFYKKRGQFIKLA